jgi:hypothetical protein
MYWLLKTKYLPFLLHFQAAWVLRFVSWKLLYLFRIFSCFRLFEIKLVSLKKEDKFLRKKKCQDFFVEGWEKNFRPCYIYNEYLCNADRGLTFWKQKKEEKKIQHDNGD